jgi:hypothetical protein
MCTLLLNLIKVKIIVWNNQTAKSSKRNPVQLKYAVYAEKQKNGTGIATGRTIILVLLSWNFNQEISLLTLMMKIG